MWGQLSTVVRATKDARCGVATCTKTVPRAQVYIHQSWNKSRDADYALYSEDLKNESYLNSFIYIYKLSLGTFETDGFSGLN